MSATKTKKDSRKKQKAEQPIVRRRFYKRATKDEIAVVKSGRKKLPSAFTLLFQVFQQLIEQWKLLGGILLVYALIDLVLVGGNTANTSLPAAKSGLMNLLHGNIDNFTSGFTLFSFLVNSGNTANSDAASAYELMLLLIVSVVYIWALRQIYANQKVRIRDAFYVGTYPLVPFILILLVMGVQLLPLVMGVSFYTNLLTGGYLVGVPAHIIALFISLLLASWTVYMLCSSIIALYIVTLPDMTPWKALMAARDLVRFRRWIVLRKLLVLIVTVAIGGIVLLVPIALFATPFAMFCFLLITALTVGVIHSFVYGLYREML